VAGGCVWKKAIVTPRTQRRVRCDVVCDDRNARVCRVRDRSSVCSGSIVFLEIRIVPPPLVRNKSPPPTTSNTHTRICVIFVYTMTVFIIYDIEPLTLADIETRADHLTSRAHTYLWHNARRTRCFDTWSHNTTVFDYCCCCVIYITR